MPFMTCQWSTQIFPLPSPRCQWSRSITSPTWHANDQDHSVLVFGIFEMSVIECLSWHASDLYRSFSYLPWDVSDHDQSHLLPVMLMIKIIQFSSPEMSVIWINRVPFMTCQWSTDLSGFFPEMSLISDQLELLPVMLMVKIIQFSSLRCQWSNAFHDIPVI